MPIIKTVSVTYGRKVNLGDFNSANVECSIWADVQEDENLGSVMGSLWDMAKTNVKAQVLPLVDKQVNARTEMLFLGLPIEENKEVA